MVYSANIILRVLLTILHNSTFRELITLILTLRIVYSYIVCVFMFLIEIHKES